MLTHYARALRRLAATAALAVWAVSLAPPSSAETTEERLRALEQQVQALRAEVEALRSQGVPADRLAELERRMELLSREIESLRIGEAAAETPLASRYGLGPAASKVYSREKGGVSIGGYGEGLYESRSGDTDTADLLRAVFYFGYKWTDTILFNSEIEFEHATTGEGDEEKGEASVEFANIDFLLSEPANVRAGLVLIPVGFLNELHEPTVFYGTRRPIVEQLIIPTTWREIGVGGFGDLGPVAWRAYVVAGLDAEEFTAEEGIREGRQGGSQSKAEDLALTGRADWTIAPGLLLGGSAFAGNSGQGLEDPAGRQLEVKTVLYEAHAEWKWRMLRTRALAARTHIDDAGRLNDTLGFIGAESVGSRQAGWYAESGVDVLGFLRKPSTHSVVLFARHEAFDTQRRVPSGFQRDPANDGTVWTFGADWKPIPNVVVKLTHQDFDTRSGAAEGDRTSLGLGFIF